MTISEKIKAISNIIEQKKAQYNLDTQTAKIFALSSGNVSKCEFLIGKDVLREKEYSLLGKELRKETNVAEKLYQKFESD